METNDLGIEGITDGDRAYAGSRFSELRQALFANPYQKVWGAPGEPPLPQYRVTLGSVLRGLYRATRRTVDSHADLRFGPDGKGYRRLLHPNAVGLTGRWEITEASDYSGYFRAGSRGLLVVRYSTCCNATRSGETRSLSLVGKLYPTLDPDHAEPLRPANFFTQQDLGGDRSESIHDAELRNAPDTHAFRRGFGFPILALSGLFFGLVDREPDIRQLYEIAELGKPPGEPTRAPAYLRLRVAPGQPRQSGPGLDFRDEVLGQIYDRGNPAPQRTLTFLIETTDEARKHGLPIAVTRTFGPWKPLGRIVFDEAVASYNGDFVIHYHHPTWRKDRNDPATATRVGGRKVR